jgi:preprotein translocase subunit SecB
MNNESIIKLKKYTVEKIEYELNKSFDFSKPKTIKISPRFQRSVQNIDEQNYEITLSVHIDCEKGKDEIPFQASITLSGRFYVDQIKSLPSKEILIDNSTAILFPYLRALLTNITSNTSLPPYMLPIMNISQLFKADQNGK